MTVRKLIEVLSTLPPEVLDTPIVVDLDGRAREVTTIVFWDVPINREWVERVELRTIPPQDSEGLIYTD